MTSVKVVVSRSICAIFSEEFAEIFVRTTKRPPRTQGICAPASQQHFSLRTNHPPSISQQCFSQNKSALATSRTNALFDETFFLLTAQIYFKFFIKEPTHLGVAAVSVTDAALPTLSEERLVHGSRSINEEEKTKTKTGVGGKSRPDLAHLSHRYPLGVRVCLEGTLSQAARLFQGRKQTAEWITAAAARAHRSPCRAGSSSSGWKARRLHHPTPTHPCTASSGGLETSGGGVPSPPPMLKVALAR
jgi:hypothetical protein